MQVILREDVHNLGRSGQLVNVKPGYGRNFLIPRGLAVLASSDNVRQLEHHRRMIEKMELKRLATASALKQKIEGISINIAKQTGEEDKLFGSVTVREIAEALEAQGVPIDRKQIQLDAPLKSLGVHPVKIRLARDVFAELKVWVVAAD